MYSLIWFGWELKHLLEEASLHSRQWPLNGLQRTPERVSGMTLTADRSETRPRTWTGSSMITLLLYRDSYLSRLGRSTSNSFSTGRKRQRRPVYVLCHYKMRLIVTVIILARARSWCPCWNHIVKAAKYFSRGVLELQSNPQPLVGVLIEAIFYPWKENPIITVPPCPTCSWFSMLE